VEVDGAPLADLVPFPPPGSALPPEARAILGVPRPQDPDADLLAVRLLAGCRSELEAVERVVAYTSLRIRYTLPGAGLESATSCRRLGRGSCVGRSLLAEDLLVRAGIPARQVTGLLVADNPSELTPESRLVYNAALGGVRHRWIEVFVPGLGWVASDPGGLANTVTSRHLALAAQPDGGFRVETVARTPELRRVAIPAFPGGPSGLTLARPRDPRVEAASVQVPGAAPVRTGDSRR
jgi:Transglutaminase-like superfamily